MLKSKNLNKIIGIAVVILALGAIIWAGRPSVPRNGQANLSQGQTAGLTAEETEFDFGAIKISEGVVTHTFKIKNLSGQKITAVKLYTSCMCTTATLAVDEDRIGPFGMPGHGFIPRFKKDIEADKEISIDVAFDPAAHGPAGVGRIERAVYLETKDGAALELEISADVTP